jgi:glycosyltransferase involved in cell wall biosynthesis
VSSGRLRVVLVLKTSNGCLWTLPQVAELRSRGHEVVAVLPPGDGAIRRALTGQGVSIVDSAFGFRFRPRLSTVVGLIRLRRQLRRLAPDVLLYHLYASALATRLASLGFGVPRVHMVPGPLYLESPVIRAVERLLVRLDSVTISGSRFTARCYQRLGRPAERTPTIPYGVDTHLFRPRDRAIRDPVRARLGIAPTDLLVIMVALVYAPKRMVHSGHGVKGHAVLLDAWHRFRADHPDSRLLIVGGGFDEAGERHRRELIARYRPDRSGAVWLGTTEDVRPYYAAADLSVSPSLSDNHGSALEAGAMGLPSIVTDAGALPETGDPGSCWIVPAGDSEALAAALARAHAEHARGRLASRGTEARARVVRLFDAANAASAVADVIERVAGLRDTSAQRTRVITVCTELRFGRDQTGRCAAVDDAGGRLAWARYLTNGDRVRLVGRTDRRPGAGRIALQDGVDVAELPNYVGLPGLLRSLPRLAFSLYREVARADVVVLRLPGAIGSLGALTAWTLRRRYAVEVVGDPCDVLAAGVLGPVGRRAAPVARAFLRRAVRRASASQFVTETTLQRQYPPAPNTPTVSVSNVRLGADAFVTRPRRWRPAPFQVITIGSHEQHYKGHDVLLRALHRLVADGLDVTAVVVGGGRRHGELVELGRSLELAGRVSFTGAIHDRARIVELLDSSSVFALPSRTEGLPRALLEAMARALPAVGSDIGGIPELLDPRMLVRVDDERALAESIRTLLLDRTAWEEQSSRNLRRAHAYEQWHLEERFQSWLAAVPAARRP